MDKVSVRHGESLLSVTTVTQAQARESAKRRAGGRRVAGGTLIQTARRRKKRCGIRRGGIAKTCNYLTFKHSAFTSTVTGAVDHRGDYDSHMRKIIALCIGLSFSTILFVHASENISAKPFAPMVLL